MKWLVSGAIMVMASAASAQNVTVNGNGISISGASTQITPITSAGGSGSVDTAGIHAGEVTASVSGSGNVPAYATEEADMNVSGSGNVMVQGNPPKHEMHSSGFGRITVAP